MTRIDHTGHGHEATTAARTECRNATRELRIKAAAFVARVQGTMMESYIRGTALRLGAFTDDEVLGTYGYDEGMNWVIVKGSSLSPVDLVAGIYRVCPEFNWNLFCQMWS